MILNLRDCKDYTTKVAKEKLPVKHYKFHASCIHNKKIFCPGRVDNLNSQSLPSANECPYYQEKE